MEASRNRVGLEVQEQVRDLFTQVATMKKEGG